MKVINEAEVNDIARDFGIATLAEFCADLVVGEVNVHESCLCKVSAH